MATSFILRTTRSRGDAQLSVRVRLASLGVNILQSTPITVPVEKWTLDHEGTAFNNWKRTDRGKKAFKKMAEIQDALDSLLTSGKAPTSEQVKEIIDDIYYREEREEAARKAELERQAYEAAHKMTLNRFIDNFLDQIDSGARQTEQGKNYAPSTIKSIKQAATQWKAFQQAVGREYDFDDIDMQCYYDFTAFLKNKAYTRKDGTEFKGYKINSIGKCIRQLKAFLYIAESEGYHTNSKWKDKKFKGTRIDVDTVFLTREELDAIMKLDLSKYGPGHTWARDIFMVGVWTAQRVSDYNNIAREDIETYTRKYVDKVDDPKHPGRKKDAILTEDVTVIHIRQQKTGAKVTIPCSSELKSILEKYNYQMPHLEDQVINRYIKEICRDAGITQLVEIETTSGGTPRKEKIEKCELIHTHTARRTGATLMYLAGMDIFDIMKITGHSSPAMLKRYIRADQLQVVDKIKSKYNYFD